MAPCSPFLFFISNLFPEIVNSKTNVSLRNKMFPRMESESLEDLGCSRHLQRRVTVSGLQYQISNHESEWKHLSILELFSTNNTSRKNEHVVSKPVFC